MVRGWSTNALDEQIAPDSGLFTEARIPDLAEQARAQASHRAEFVSNMAAGGGVRVKGRQLLLSAIRRTTSAVGAYQGARRLTMRYLDDPREHALDYVDAVDAWEATLGYGWEAARLIAAGAENMWFVPGDGSTFERLKALHDTARHEDRRSLERALHDELPVGVWLSNEGLKSRTHQLAFAELANALELLGGYSRIACDPKRIPETLPEELLRGHAR
jgi:hypothetical protein